MSPMRPDGGINGLEPIRGYESLSDEAAHEEALLAMWTRRVGADRAEAAMQLYRQKTGSTTLPELLVEIALRRKGLRYEAQVQMPGARPDFAVYTPEGIRIIRVQGDYWHNRPGTATRDELQKARLMRNALGGQKIISVADIWESQIYADESAVDVALQGRETP